MTQKSASHLYKRAWFGLIPIFGAFLGIWLSFLALTKYKDKKLLLIGIACILFTVAVYGSLTYYSFYTKSGRSQYISLAKLNMNNLVRDIEFYKLKHGRYPASLDHILAENKTAFVKDPISAVSEIKFYYERRDERYWLFSRGIDKVPFTQDDIFPDIDTSNIGLLRPRSN